MVKVSFFNRANMTVSTSRQDLYTQIFECLSARQNAQAQQLLEQLLKHHGDWAPAHSAAAAVAMHNDNKTEAEAHIQEALERSPHHGEYLFNRVQLLLAQHKTEAAEQACRDLPAPEQMSHKDADSCFLFARCLAPKHPEKAEAWLEAALAYYPEPEQWIVFAEQSFAISPTLMQAFLPPEIFSAGTASAQQSVWVQIYVYLCLQHLHFELAAPYLSAALGYNPELVTVVYQAIDHLWQAKAYQQLDTYFKACEPLASALPIPPHAFYRNWAICAFYNQDPLKMSAYYDKATALSPHPLTYAIERLMHFPAVYKSEQEIQLLRQQFAYQLKKLEQKVDSLLKKGDMPRHLHMRYPFGLAYQGMPDKALVSQLGRIAHRLLHRSDDVQDLDYIPSQTLPLKVGFVSTYFQNHSVMNAYGRGIAELAQDPHFEVHLLHAGEKRDQQSDWIASQVSHFVHEPSVPKAISQLKTWRLDVLIYTDIGMDPKSYLMALHRLAPIQGVFGGHPVTSGIPNMDYAFIVGNQAVAKNAVENHSEKVVFLKRGISLREYLPRPEHYTRDMFIDATPESHIYFCPMMLIKIHPAFDTALKGILVKDPQAQIYFVDNEQEPEISKQLVQRFQKTIGPALAQRIFFIPWLPKARFLEAVCAADVLLDSFGFGSGTTTYQVLSMHQPMVTLPGGLCRNSITYGHYERINMFDTVTDSVEAYVDKAVHLAYDKVYRQKLQDELALKVSDFSTGENIGLTSLKESLIYLTQHYGKLDPAQRSFSF